MEGTSEGQKQAPVFSLLSELTGRLDDLGCELTSLEERLAPVLREPQPQAETPKEAEQSGCKVELALGHVIRAVHRRIQFAQQLKERLQI